MKLSLIILQSLDGLLAKSHSDDLSWGSKIDKEFFRTKTKEIGTMIMGSTTYEAMPAGAFSDRFSLVMTSKPEKYKILKAENVEKFSGTPQEAINYLEIKGINKAALIGGGAINNAFLQANLVAEIYVTVAPVIFAKGIPSFGNLDLKTKLELTDVSNISINEVLLHYKVII